MTGVTLELSEVHALVADLDSRLRGRVVARLEPQSFPVLETLDQPVSAEERILPEKIPPSWSGH